MTIMPSTRIRRRPHLGYVGVSAWTLRIYSLQLPISAIHMNQTRLTSSDDANVNVVYLVYPAILIHKASEITCFAIMDLLVETSLSLKLPWTLLPFI